MTNTVISIYCDCDIYFFISFVPCVYDCDERTNCYDNFELNSCKIMEENFEGEGEKQIATVKFIATMTQVDSREKTAFMETSTFERAGKHIRQGAWLYKIGIVEPVPVSETEEETVDDLDDSS